MKSYIAKIETLRVVQSEEYPATNQGYDTVDYKYGVIDENQPVDGELTRVTFIMWTEGLGERKVKQILNILNS